MGLNIRSLEKLPQSHEVVIFRKKISVIVEFHVFIMDKYIQSMVCLQIKQLPLLLKNEQKNKNLLK